MSTTEFCAEHGQCKQQQAQNTKDIENIKQDMDKIREEIQSIKVQQGKDNERIITVFHAIGEIKEYMRQAVDEMKKMNEKLDEKIDQKLQQAEATIENSLHENSSDTDEFSKFLKNFALDLLKWGCIAGISVYFVHFLGVKIPIR